METVEVEVTLVDVDDEATVDEDVVDDTEVEDVDVDVVEVDDVDVDEVEVEMMLPVEALTISVPRAVCGIPESLLV